jgi:glycosyltransferase involved in cell wall biosynthesis
MNILYLSQLMPYPPDAGAKVRQYFTLRYLAQHHRVTLAAFTRSDDPPAALQHMESLCAAVHTVPMRRSRGRDALALAGSWLKGESFIIRRDLVPEMVELVKAEIAAGGYDAVHADQLWMAQYALLAKGSVPRLVLDEHNACYQIFERLAQGERNPLKRAALEREWRALRDFEASACAQFDHVVTVTEEDRGILEGMVEAAGNQVNREQATWRSGDKRPAFTTIPICVDTEGVRAVEPAMGAPNVLHLGTMFWPPNVEGVLWFAREVWPRVQAEIPGATFTVVGKNPPLAVRDLQAEGSGIEVTGYVPDPLPYLQRAGAFVVPLFSAGGMRVKIVDGWRWGLPIVSTTIGAEGITYRDGEPSAGAEDKNICIADEAVSFATAVVRLLQDGELNSRLRQNGRQWVEEKYDWQRVYPAWEQIYSG